MTVFEAIILGIVQGLTEFIPVSSSGHLIAVPHILGWEYQGKAFDVAVHLGTLVAVAGYYRRDWVLIIRGFFAGFARHRKKPVDEKTAAAGRMLLPILVACVPAAVVGVLWQDAIENRLNEWYYVAPALVVFGLVLLAADRLGRKTRPEESMRYADYLIIGCAQALALFPGVSRSGITISAALFLGLDRATAARFSFLISTPIIFGAGFVSLGGLVSEGFPASEIPAFVWGFVSAAISGYAAIHFLISYLRRFPVDVFVIYRILLAAFLVALFVFKG